ncbi:GIY-YIG nuclease family protein [Streptomyces fungicidicus]|uniref:GIY-YIG nuclease family protein n=1 Tax=Streptomyces fungicidicus TaxID=68203 RepID=UPI003820DEEE
MTLTYTCAWINRHTGEQCGKPAKVQANLPLCPDHHQARTYREKAKRGAELLRYFKENPEAPRSAGWCYIVHLPDCTVKVGMVGTEGRLSARLAELHEDFGGNVDILAVLPGGKDTEAVLHSHFGSIRIPGKGERFDVTEPARVSGELLSFALSHGIHPEALPAVEEYREWADDPDAWAARQLA